MPEDESPYCIKSIFQNGHGQAILITEDARLFLLNEDGSTCEIPWRGGWATEYGFEVTVKDTHGSY